ncbi:MAG: ABC transporter permease [Dehalococcoidales bacterium]|nr:ABC transporter permease [Dehalococcoidales bacterium]
MFAYIVRRLILGVIVIFLVTIMVFVFVKLIPGDPAVTILGLQASREQLDALRKELWLDRPLLEQYGHWLTDAIQGDLGKSVMYKRNVSELIAARLPVTVHLAGVAFIISTLVGITFGIVCAIRRGKVSDSIITLLANLGVALPVFWLGIMGAYYFGLKLSWIPIQGYTSPFDDFWLSTRQAILPVICLAIHSIAILTRQTRSSMLEVVRQDYIRTARVKGLKERVIILKHALKNALIPVITLLGVEVGLLVGGSVLIENVFNIPGMGRLIVQAALNKDIPVIQACTLIIAMITVIANLTVDLAYGWLDPRIRYD